MKPWALYVFAVIGFLLYAGRNQVKSLIISTQDALANPNVQAYGNTVGTFESNNDYTILFGGGHFSDFATHPNVRVPFHNPNKPPHPDGSPNDYSTAAGKYQINHPTWLILSALPGAPGDFGPEAQEWFFVALLKINGALAPIVAGDFVTATKLASKTWASLPYTDSGQHHVTLAEAQSVYQDNGGTLA